MLIRSLALSLITCSCLSQLPAQEHIAAPTPDMQWRMIGPFRGGRTRAATGVPGEPNVFYVGPVDGGGWKSDDCRSHTRTLVLDPR
jgi:hypothetical protein